MHYNTDYDRVQYNQESERERERDWEYLRERKSLQVFVNYSLGKNRERFLQNAHQHMEHWGENEIICAKRARESQRAERIIVWSQVLTIHTKHMCWTHDDVRFKRIKNNINFCVGISTRVRFWILVHLHRAKRLCSLKHIRWLKH